MLSPSPVQHNVCGRRIENIADCTDIFDSTINVIECTRPAQPAIAEWVERIQPFSVPLAYEIEVNDANIDKLYNDIQEFLIDSWIPDPEIIIPDIQALAELYTHLVEPSSIGLRITYLTEAMCSKWHQDYVGIRLVCTYGASSTPGTEWIDPEYVNQDYLGFRNSKQRDDSAEVIRDASKINQMVPFSVGLLKGANWQGNEASPAIHRSPPGHYKRVLITLDTLN
jgi:hypothetical protein